MPDKPKLSDEERAELRSVVKAAVRDMLSRREELQDNAAVQRALWKAMVESPTWSVMNVEKPKDAQDFDELWSMKPTVTKR
jgi:hypothetical protein